MALVCCESAVLFGEPVHNGCVAALFMAFHERLGEGSPLARLEPELLRDLAKEALDERRVTGEYRKKRSISLDPRHSLFQKTVAILATTVGRHYIYKHEWQP